MLLWLVIAVLATLVTAILWWAARRNAESSGEGTTPTEDHFRAQLAEIEQDFQNGELNEAAAEAARAELAREVIAHRKSEGRARPSFSGSRRIVLMTLTVAVPVFALVIYAAIGNPTLPGAPLAGRDTQVESKQRFDAALTQLQTHLKDSPDDMRGWQVLGQAYMQAGRYAEAETAFRRIVDLTDPDADALTDLAEAELMQNQGVANQESLDLLQQAADLDPAHVRSRFYLAGEATRAGHWDEAVTRWAELIGLATGDENWLPIAKRGLLLAQNQGQVPESGDSAAGGDATQGPGPDRSGMIANMVEGLSARLAEQGGSVAEWTQLVRSRLVLGQTELAQTAYDDAVTAYPDAADRQQLDELAQSQGLKTND